MKTLAVVLSVNLLLAVDGFANWQDRVDPSRQQDAAIRQTELDRRQDEEDSRSLELESQRMRGQEMQERHEEGRRLEDQNRSDDRLKDALDVHSWQSDPGER